MNNEDRHEHILTFTEEDMFDFDTHLADFLCANLKKFRTLAEDKQGVPVEFLDDIHSPTEEDLEQGHQKYLDVIDRIIYAFDLTQQPDIGNYAFDFESVPLGNGHYRMDLVEDDYGAHERYGEDMRQYHEKCKEGRLLLAQYFHCLWL